MIKSARHSCTNFYTSHLFRANTSSISSCTIYPAKNCYMSLPDGVEYNGALNTYTSFPPDINLNSNFLINVVLPTPLTPEIAIIFVIFVPEFFYSIKWTIQWGMDMSPKEITALFVFVTCKKDWMCLLAYSVSRYITTNVQMGRNVTCAVRYTMQTRWWITKKNCWTITTIIWSPISTMKHTTTILPYQMRMTLTMRTGCRTDPNTPNSWGLVPWGLRGLLRCNSDRRKFLSILLHFTTHLWALFSRRRTDRRLIIFCHKIRYLLNFFTVYHSRMKWGHW